MRTIFAIKILIIYKIVGLDEETTSECETEFLMNVLYGVLEVRKMLENLFAFLTNA